MDDFNDDISKIGSDAPELIASLSNGFVSECSLCQSKQRPIADILPVVWVAYAFYAVPLVSSLAKLHVAGGKA